MQSIPEANKRILAEEIATDETSLDQGQMRSDTVQQDPYVSRQIMPKKCLQPVRYSGKEGVDIERVLCRPTGLVSEWKSS